MLINIYSLGVTDESNESLVLGKLDRLPMKSNLDEALSSVHVRASTFTDYLHENYPTYMNDIESFAQAASYLSDSASLSPSASLNDTLSELMLDNYALYAYYVCH